MLCFKGQDRNHWYQTDNQKCILKWYQCNCYTVCSGTGRKKHGGRCLINYESLSKQEREAYLYISQL